MGERPCRFKSWSRKSVAENLPAQVHVWSEMKGKIRFTKTIEEEEEASFPAQVSMVREAQRGKVSWKFTNKVKWELARDKKTGRSTIFDC